MAAPYNVVLQLQLQSPTNLSSVISDIQRRLSGINASVNIQLNAASVQALAQLNQQLGALQGNLNNTSSQASNAASNINKLTAAHSAASSQIANTNAQLSNSSGVMRANQVATFEASHALENFGIQAGLAARRYSAFLLAGGAIITFANELRNALGDALRFQREMVRLSQIGNETSGSLRDMESEVTRLATTWGTSSRELIAATVQLRQAGLTATDTKIALDALAKSSLAPSFGSMTETAEGLIAVMNQFKVSATEAAGVLGSINAVSTQYAVSSRDIIDAVRRTGGEFRSAGGNINELIALFGAVRSTSRESAESIGTSLRTIFARVQRASVIEDLRRLNVELVHSREEAARMGDSGLAGQFVGPYEAVRRLSQALGGLRSTDPRYAGIAEQLGGYRQLEKVIPLLQEFGRAQSIYQTAQAGSNSLTRSAEQAQEAFLVRLTKVREEFSALIRTITESKGFQVFLDMVIQLTSAFTQLAGVLSPLIPLIAGVATFKLAQGIGRIGGGLLAGLGGQSPSYGAAGAGIRGYASGGIVPGHGDSDSVYANLTPGEYVIRKQAARRIGYRNLERINRYADGGSVRMADGGIPEELVGRGASRSSFILNPAGGQTYEISGQQATEAQLKGFLLRGENIPGVAGQARSQSPLNPIGREGKKTAEFLAGNKAGTAGYMNVPFNQNDNLGFITMDSATKGGITIRSIGRKQVAAENASDASLKLMDAQGSIGLQGPVATLIMPSRATAEFKIGLVSQVSEGIHKAFQNYFVDAAGKPSTHDFHPKSNALDSLTGNLFESYVNGLVASTGIMTQGGLANFDLPPTAPGTSALGTSELTHALYPKDLAAKVNMMDIKASAKSSSGQSLLVKYLNNYVKTHPQPEIAQKASGGIIDSVPALLTPGEFVVNASAAQRIGYSNLDRMNASGISRFADGGFVPYPGAELIPQNVWSSRRFRPHPEGVLPVTTGGISVPGGGGGNSPLLLVPQANLAGNVTPDVSIPFSLTGNPLTQSNVVNTLPRGYGLAPAGTAINGATSPRGLFDYQNTIGYNPGTYPIVETHAETMARTEARARQLFSGPQRATQDMYTTGYGTAAYAGEFSPNRSTYAASMAGMPLGERIANIGTQAQGLTGQVSELTQRQTRLQELNRLYRQTIQAEEKILAETNKSVSPVERTRLAIENTERKFRQVEGSISSSIGRPVSALGQGTVGGMLAAEAGAAGAPPGGSRMGAFANYLRSNARMIGGALGTVGLMYGSQAIIGAGGTAEHAAAAGTGGSYIAAQTAGGALQGVATGAAIGSFLGPWGTAVGAVIGGLGGLATSFFSASREIEKATLQIAQRNTGEALTRAMRTGTVATDTFSVENREYNRRVNEITQGGFSRRARPITNAEREAIRAETFGATEQRYGEYLQGRATVLARRNPNMSAQQLSEALSRENYGQASTVLGNRADTVINETAAATRRQVGAEVGRAQAAIIVQDFQALTLALRNATGVVAEFTRAAQLSSAVFGGQVTAGTIANPAEHINQLGGPNPEDFRGSVNRIASGFGTRGNTFRQTGYALDDVRRQMIAALPALATGGQLQPESYRERLTTGVNAGLGGARNAYTDRILESSGRVLGGMSISDIETHMRENPEALVDRILRPIMGPFQQHAQEMGQLLQQAAQAFANAVTTFQQQMQRVGQAQDAAARGQTTYVREAALTAGRADFSSGASLYNLPMATLQMPFTARQQRLTAGAGLVGAAAFSPEAIGNALLSTNRQISGLSRQRENTPFGPAMDSLTERIGRLTSTSSNLQQALEHLSNAANANAAIEERLAALHRDQEGRFSLAERFLTGDPRTRMQLIQGQQLSQMVAGQGTQAGYGLSTSQLGTFFQFAQSAPGTMMGGRTLEDWRRLVIANRGDQIGGLFAPRGRGDEIGQLEGQRLGGIRTAAAAQGTFGRVLGTMAEEQFTGARGLIGSINIQTRLANNIQSLDTAVRSLTEVILRSTGQGGGGTFARAFRMAGYAQGGDVFRPRGSDTVPAMLTPGEFVVNRDSAQRHRQLLERINSSRTAYMADGGPTRREYDPLLDWPPPRPGSGTLLRTDMWNPTRGRLPTFTTPQMMGIAGIGEGGAPIFGAAANTMLQYMRATRGSVLPDAERIGAPRRRAIRPTALAGFATTDADRNGLLASTPAELEQARLNRTIGTSPRSIEALTAGMGGDMSSIESIRGMIGQARNLMGTDFTRGAYASTIGRGLSGLNIGQTAPGIADQYNYGNITRGRIAQTRTSMEMVGSTIDARAGMSGLFGRQQVAMGAAADVPSMSTNNWVLDRSGNIQGQLVGGNFVVSPSMAQGMMSGGARWTNDDLARMVLRPDSGVSLLSSHRDWRIQRFAGGGYVYGAGISDSTPALLSAGEFVLNSRATRNVGVDNLQRFNEGGPVGYYANGNIVSPTNPEGGGTNFAPTNFREDISRLQSVFANFTSTANSLAAAISKIPPSIQLSANHNLNVNVNGAEAFESMKDTFGKMLVSYTEDAINNLISEKFPEVGRMDSSLNNQVSKSSNNYEDGRLNSNGK